jgi:hypothetical protein
VRDDPEVPFPVFVDLFKSADNPDVYHGKPVTLTGHIRLLREVPAGENSYGIATLYEAWLYTEDSQNNPACIVCTMLPDGMLQAFDASRSHVLDQVSVTGYFFKMMGYPAEDVYRYAPLILAQRLEWRRIEQPKPNPWLSKYGIPIALAVALGVILLVRFLTRPGRAFRERRLHAEQPETSFDSLFDDGK